MKKFLDLKPLGDHRCINFAPPGVLTAFPRLHPSAIPEFILVIIIGFILVIIIIVRKNVIPILGFEAIGRSQVH